MKERDDQKIWQTARRQVTITHRDQEQTQSWDQSVAFLASDWADWGWRWRGSTGEKLEGARRRRSGASSTWWWPRGNDAEVTAVRHARRCDGGSAVAFAPHVSSIAARALHVVSNPGKNAGRLMPWAKTQLLQRRRNEFIVIRVMNHWSHEPHDTLPVERYTPQLDRVFPCGCNYLWSISATAK